MIARHDTVTLSPEARRLLTAREVPAPPVRRLGESLLRLTRSSVWLVIYMIALVVTLAVVVLLAPFSLLIADAGRREGVVR